MTMQHSIPMKVRNESVEDDNASSSSSSHFSSAHHNGLNGSLDETKSFEMSGSDSEQDMTANQSIPKTATWTTASLLMIADVVGAGVMSLATAFAQLGWVLALLSLVLWYFVNMYVGLLVAESRQVWPRSESLMDLGYFAFGKRTRFWTGLAVYTFLAFVLGDYVLILGETLQLIFYEAPKCRIMWSALGCLFLLPLSQIRLLALTTGLMILNVGTIIGSIVLALVALGNMSQSEEYEVTGNLTVFTEAVASNLTLLSFFHSQALFAFAYIGVFIYLEIISEMRDPSEFRKALLWFSGPFQFVVYLVTGALGYYFIGSTANGLLIKQMPEGPMSRMAAIFLAIHMILTFLVKGTVLSRALHSLIFPSTAKDFNARVAYRTYFMISVFMLLFCFLVANLVPFFDDLTSFLGALQTPFIGFILPIVFVLKSRKPIARRTERWEAAFMTFIVVFMILLFFIGVASSLSNMVAKWTSYGTPFSNC